MIFEGLSTHEAGGFLYIDETGGWNSFVAVEVLGKIFVMALAVMTLAIRIGVVVSRSFLFVLSEGTQFNL